MSKITMLQKSIIAGLFATVVVMPGTVSHAANRYINNVYVVGTAEFTSEDGVGQADGGWIVLQNWRHKQPSKADYHVEGNVLKVTVNNKESQIRLPEYIKDAKKTKLVNENNNLFVEYRGDRIIRLWCGRIVEYRTTGRQTTAYFVPFYRVKDNEQIKNQYLIECVDDVVAEMAGYKKI